MSYVYALITLDIDSTKDESRRDDFYKELDKQGLTKLAGKTEPDTAWEARLHYVDKDSEARKNLEKKCFDGIQTAKTNAGLKGKVKIALHAGIAPVRKKDL